MGHPSFTRVCFWAYPGGLGFALVRAKCRGGPAAWVAGVLAAPGTQRSWQLVQKSSRRVWQPVLANVLQYSYLENPNREACQAIVYRVAKSWTCMKWSCLHRCKTFFFFFFGLWQLCPSESWAWRWRSLWGPWQHQVCGDMDCLHRRKYGPLSLFQASCSWCSECLFGQPFSVGLPIQALRGPPCLRSVSVVRHVRHTEGPSWVGSYSVVQCLRRLMGQPLYCSAAEAGKWGNREAMVMALLSWLPGFSPQAFPTIFFLFTSPQSVSL